MELHFLLPVGEKFNHSVPLIHSIHTKLAGWNRWKCNEYESFACGLTTSLTAETGTVRGEGVGGGEGGTAMEEVGGEEDGGARVLRGAGSVLLVTPEGKEGTLSVFRLAELSKAGIRTS